MSPSVALERLEGTLRDRGIEAEIMLVGGAVMSLIFDARPETRRAAALFAERGLLTDATDDVAREFGLPPDWLSSGARQLVGTEGTSGGGHDGSNLRVFSPTPEYALAMKCAELGRVTGEDRRQVESDVRYLLRLIGALGVPDALERVHVYFSDRQLPDDLPDRLGELF